MYFKRVGEIRLSFAKMSKEVAFSGNHGKIKKNKFLLITHTTLKTLKGMRGKGMEAVDTVKLLKECDAGTKMAVSSIDDVLEKVQDSELKSLLQESKSHHEKLETEISSMLRNHNAEEKEPNPMAKGMSWMKTNMKMTMDNSDSTVADLITDGCNMGVKTLNRYLNQYKAADEESKAICGKLISIEEQLCKDMRTYL